jgi:hypothetical protein
MGKVDLPAGRGNAAFDRAVKKITDSVRVQHERSSPDMRNSLFRTSAPALHQDSKNKGRK